MYFPPSFFDIMVHLIVHLVMEIKLCGLVFLWWMYSLEHYMKILKSYTHLYILNNTKEVQSYLFAHQDILKKKNPQMKKNGSLTSTTKHS
ncbi:hypothetical protein CR513_09504, partial [Mucuna pruriens]